MTSWRSELLDGVVLMRVVGRRSAVLLAGLAVGLVGPAAASVGVPAVLPSTLVGIRAAHHPGFDRVVFEFRGGLPEAHRVRYVDRLVADGSGKPVRVAGRAVLQVGFTGTNAHDAGGPTAPARTAYALPNVLTTVRSGDFEAVTTYGIGLAARTPFRVSTATGPARVVVDVRAAFPTVDRAVYFLDRDRFRSGHEPFFVPRTRPVRPRTPAQGLLDRLFAGPTAGERATGLRLVRSGATGFTGLSIAGGIARVRLTGGCDSHGSTATIAGEIMPTLRRLASVDRVKIYDPAGHTERPTGHTDSIPTCLEP